MEVGCAEGEIMEGDGAVASFGEDVGKERVRGKPFGGEYLQVQEVQGSVSIQVAGEGEIVGSDPDLGGEFVVHVGFIVED